MSEWLGLEYISHATMRELCAEYARAMRELCAEVARGCAEVARRLRGGGCAEVARRLRGGCADYAR